MAPLLSICIPTRNRADKLKITLEHFTDERVFLETDDIEILISDNASEDNTKEICEFYAGKFPNKIRYFRHEQNIGNDNFPFVLNQAKGKYAKLNNDTCCFLKDKLEKFVNIIKEYPNSAAFFITEQGNEETVTECNNSDEFFRATSYLNTGIAAFCVDAKEFRKVENPTKYAEKKLCQVDILGRLIKNQKSVVINGKYLFIQQVGNKSGYNVAEIFGQNYCTILQDLISQGLLSENTYQYIKKSVLINHINYQYFDIHKEFHFNKNGYFKFLFPYYKYDLYFYIQFVKYLFLDFLFRFQITSKIYILIKNAVKQYLWRKNNRNNKTWLGIPLNLSERNRISVGDNTKGILNVQFNDTIHSVLKIGENCLISDKVFFVFDDNKNITVGNNVSIRESVIIHSGENIPDDSCIKSN